MKFTLALVAVVGVARANWKSGSVSTFDTFTYGKFVTHMKAPNKKGTVASFYTYWDGPGFYPGGWNELDFNVVPSVAATPLSMNAIFGDGHNKAEEHAYADVAVGEDWHTYEMAWTPRYIAFSVDGVEQRRLSADDSAAVQLMHKAQSLRMNFWTPTFHSWGAGFDAADMPWYVLYDYVEVYRYDGDGDSFELAWRDDFNRFDETRWHKASGSFENNSSVFHPSNVYTSNGNLVIKMEPLDGHEAEHEHHAEQSHSLLHAGDVHGDASLHHGVHRREDGQLVHDAVPGLDRAYDQHEHLGHLAPRHDLINERSHDFHVHEPLSLEQGHHLTAHALPHYNIEGNQQSQQKQQQTKQSTSE